MSVSRPPLNNPPVPNSIRNPDLYSYLEQLRSLLQLDRELGFGDATRFAFRSTALDYTAKTDDATIWVDASLGPVTVTLYSLAENLGRRLSISKRDSSANAVTIQTPDGATINGAATQTIATQYNAIALVAGDTEWGFM